MFPFEPLKPGNVDPILHVVMAQKKARYHAQQNQDWVRSSQSSKYPVLEPCAFCIILSASRPKYFVHWLDFVDNRNFGLVIFSGFLFMLERQ